jgi:glycosylphosphatidylinositol transamidase (GPIT) subunit GPI8
LHTRNAQDSRNIIGESGCENLPRYGRALIRYSNEVELQEVEIPMVSEEDLDGITRYRTQQAKNMDDKPVIKDETNIPIIKTGKDFTKVDNIEWTNKEEIMERMSQIYRKGGLI